MEQQGRLALLSIYIDEDVAAWYQGLMLLMETLN